MLFLIVLNIVFVFVQGDYIYSDDGTCTIDGVSLKCVPLKDCPSALKDVKNKGKPQFQICQFDGIHPLVCCKDTGNASEGQLDEDLSSKLLTSEKDNCGRLPLGKTASKANDKCLEYERRLVYPCMTYPTLNITVLDNKCPASFGHISGEGGEDAEENVFRHMALLLYGPDEPSYKFCGGSVISEKFILTAGHCMQSSVGPVSVAITGLLKRSDTGGRRNRIKNIIGHPEYASPIQYHDIALLETWEEILLDSRVVPVCLHTGQDPGAAEVSVTGWGKLGRRKPVADHLQKVPLFKNNNCSKVYGPHRWLTKGFDEVTQMCFGDDGTVRDTCEGDSGGPVQVRTRECMFTALAVVSFGKDCGQLGTPAVYTRVSHYVSWIESVVWP